MNNLFLINLWSGIKKIIFTNEKNNGTRKEVQCSCGKKVKLPKKELSKISKTG
jgi:hypothetical protein